MAHRDTLLAGVAGAAPDETMDRRLSRALLIALADKLGVFDEDGNIQGVEQHQIVPQAMIGGRRLRAYMGHSPVEIRRMAGSDEDAAKVFTALGITPEDAEADFRRYDEEERARRQQARAAMAAFQDAREDDWEPETQPQAPEASASTVPGSTTTATAEEAENASTGLAAFRAAQAAKDATANPATPVSAEAALAIPVQETTATAETGDGETKAPAKEATKASAKS